MCILVVINYGVLKGVAKVKKNYYCCFVIKHLFTQNIIQT